MCVHFSPDEIGKAVENAAGERVGVVTAVEQDVASIRPSPGVLDSHKSSLGWDGIAEQRQQLHVDAVRDITDDVVRLEGELPAGEYSPVANSDGDLVH